jgi:hypothetical protein
MSERNNDTVHVSSVPTGAMLVFLGVVAVLAMQGVTIMGRTAWILAALAPLVWAIPTVIYCLRSEGLSGRSIAIIASALIPVAFVLAAILGVSIGRWWPLFAIAIGIGLSFGGRR